MSAVYRIYEAAANDAAALEALINSAFRGDSSRRGWTHEADLIQGELRTDRQVLLDLIADPQATLLILADDEPGALPLASVLLKNQGEWLYLGMLTVAPDRQGEGLGKKLLAAAEEHARTTGCRGIEMTVISDRIELIDWYVRHGYRPTGETRPFEVSPKYGTPVRPLTFVVLTKPVG
jgi:predicted N-acetyltransferase YhbS